MGLPPEPDVFAGGRQRFMEVTLEMVEPRTVNGTAIPDRIGGVHVHVEEYGTSRTHLCEELGAVFGRDKSEAGRLDS